MPLVIGRRVGESIKIGKDVEITVDRLLGGQVRLVIKAPREISVMRTELLERGRKLVSRAKT